MTVSKPEIRTAFMGRRKSRSVVLAGVSALAFSLALSGAAVAADAADEDQQQTLDEVLVTARRTSENVQTTPVSVSAVSLEQIQNLNITRLENIQQLAPNLTVVANGPSSVAPMLYLRGIGSPSVALYSEPPVALYLDGVYTPRPTSAAFDVPDMSGIQVLRGPQGTLFGRNTTGGAILITTEAPRREFGGSARLSYGSNNDIIGSVVLHSGEVGPLGLRAKVVLQDRERDGWVRFPGFDKDEWGGSLHSKAASLTVAADLNDKFSVEGMVNYSKLRSAVGFQTLAASAGATAYFNQSATNPGSPPFLMSTKPLDIAYRDPRNPKNEAEIQTRAARASFTFDGGETFQLKGITGYSDIEQDLTGQLGGSYVRGAVNVLGVTTIQPILTHLTPDGPGTQRQFSQELNATGKVGNFSYVAGMYLFTEHASETVRTLQMNAPTGAAFVATVTDRSVIYAGSTKSVGAYGQLGYKPPIFNDKLELSAGLRFSEDKKTLISQTFATSSATGLTTVTGTNIITGLPGSSTVPGAIRGSTAKDSWSNSGWSLSASYEVTPDIYAFIRSSSAFRAGGFNSISTNSPGYAPEQAVSTEWGIKSEWFDRRLRINAVGFHTDYSDLQISQYIGPPRNTTFITNAGSSTYDGYEIEAQAILGGGFKADANYGYVFPKYKEYIIGATPLPGLCAATPNDPSCFQNVAGQARFPFLSKQSFHVGVQYESPTTPVGVITLRTDFSYKSSFLFSSLDMLSPNNTKVHSGIDRNLSARIILSDIPLGGDRLHLKLQVFGDNLTDNRYIVEAVDLSTTMNGIFNRPRNFGLILSAEF